MAVESATDRAVFVDIDDFGSAATYTPSGGSASTVNGIFDNDFIEVDAGGGVGVALQQPRFHCRTADVSSAATDTRCNRDRVDRLDHHRVKRVSIAHLSAGNH